MMRYITTHGGGFFGRGRSVVLDFCIILLAVQKVNLIVRVVGSLDSLFRCGWWYWYYNHWNNNFSAYIWVRSDGHGKKNRLKASTATQRSPLAGGAHTSTPFVYKREMCGSVRVDELFDREKERIWEDLERESYLQNWRASLRCQITNTESSAGIIMYLSRAFEWVSEWVEWYDAVEYNDNT